MGEERGDGEHGVLPVAQSVLGEPFAAVVPCQIARRCVVVESINPSVSLCVDKCYGRWTPLSNEKVRVKSTEP